MKIILLGAPGSGKGTISNELMQKEHYEHVSTGDLFRKVIDSNSPIADQLKTILTSGQLVSDDITNAIVRDELLKLSHENKDFVLDGYPRTIDQAKFLASIVKIDAVILVNIDQELAIKRISGRRLCKTCGAIYNIYFKKPLHENVCDLDGSYLYQRKDDDQAIALKRFEVYFQQTQPLIDFYRNQGILHEIDANNTNIDQLMQQVYRIIKK